ncbi:MAG: Gldg family protein [Verrucomicrobia bacterium]|nr:Gldg family protein [Verrucomicrobiota bacterium]
MKKNNFESLLYSVGGVALLFVAIVAFNFIAGRAKIRADLTAEKAYTLSDGTRAILSKLDTEIIVRFYVTRDEKEAPPALKVYARRVEDLLEEYREVSKGKIKIERYDPKPDSDAEDSANLDGVEGQMVRPGGDKVYLGLSINMLNEKVAIPFLIPDRERLLEYDISRAISQVMNPERPTLGVMTPLQAFGQPQAMSRFGQQPADPWVLVSELQRDFNVKQLYMTTDKIDDDIKVLVLIHPKEITALTEYAIDQFIMRGGKLIAFVDPLCYFDQQGQNPMMGGGPSSSTLDRLFAAWGVEFDTTKVVADMNFKTPLQEGDALAVLNFTEEGANKDDALSGQIDSLLLPFAGTFQGAPKDGLKKTVLFSSTKNSQLVDAFLASMPGDSIAKDFQSSGTEYPIAIRLTGKFKTAFPEGKPNASDAHDHEDGEDEEKEKKQASDNSLKESKEETAVILVADADFLQDPVAARVQNFLGQRMVMLPNGNLPFAQGAAEQLSGDSNLIAVRSRATMNRPFTLVRKMESEAQEKFRTRLKELQASLDETQRKLNELQQSKSKEQRFIMSPEQQAELENFRKKEVATSKELKELKKSLRREVESLQTRLKWINILAMPIIVAFSGIILAVVKRKRTAAK